MAIPTHAIFSISITLLWLTYVLWAIALLHPDISRSWTAVIIFSQCSCFIIKFVLPSMNTSPEIAKQPQTTINIVRMRKPWTDGMRVALGAYYLTYIIPSHNSYSVYFMKCGHNQRFHQVVDSWQVFYVTFEFFSPLSRHWKLCFWDDHCRAPTPGETRKSNILLCFISFIWDWWTLSWQAFPTLFISMILLLSSCGSYNWGTCHKNQSI